jgi:hypothetical protein
MDPLQRQPYPLAVLGKCEGGKVASKSLFACGDGPLIHFLLHEKKGWVDLKPELMLTAVECFQRLENPAPIRRAL